MSDPIETRTPAGERVKEWFHRKAPFVVSRPLDCLDFDEIAAVALNRKEFSGEERDPADASFAQELAVALKMEFGSFMRTEDDEWLATARSLLARMQARTMVLNVATSENGINGIFVYSDVDGSGLTPRAIFYEPQVSGWDQFYEAFGAPPASEDQKGDNG